MKETMLSDMHTNDIEGGISIFPPSPSTVTPPAQAQVDNDTSQKNPNRPALTSFTSRRVNFDVPPVRHFVRNTVLHFGRNRATVNHHQWSLSASTVRSNPNSIVTLLGPLVVIVMTLLIPFYIVPFIVRGEFPPPEAFLVLAVSAISVFPAVLFIGWCKYIFKKSFHLLEDEDNKDATATEMMKKRLKCSVVGVSLPLAIMFRQAVLLLIPNMIQEDYKQFYTWLLNSAAAMSMFTCWISFLDRAHEETVKYTEKLELIARRYKKYKKVKDILKNFVCNHDFSDDSDGSSKDEAHAIPGGHRSPAQVLAEIVGIYCNIGKM